MGQSMRVLVTWGSKRGGTEGIGRILATALEDLGIETVAVSSDGVVDLAGFDAAIIGGALYAGRWPRSVKQFARRHAKALRDIPVWLFSSGPLDDSANINVIPPTSQVNRLIEQTGARGHKTFGGRLKEDARGFPASAMAKNMAGDWRDEVQIREWAKDIAARLPLAVTR